MSAKIEIEYPCPFCGDLDDIHLCIQDVPDREGQPVAMQCGNCGASGPTAHSRPHDMAQNTLDAMREWNKREQWNAHGPKRTDSEEFKRYWENYGELLAACANGNIREFAKCFYEAGRDQQNNKWSGLNNEAQA